MRTASVAGFAFWAVCATQPAVAQGPVLLPPVLEDFRQLDLPHDIGVAADVRWQVDGRLLLGLRQDGVYLWRPGAGGSEALATLSGTTYRRAGRYGNYSRLGGASAGSLVFAGDLFGVYEQRNGRITALKANLEIVGDVDARDGWTVAVGLARQPEPSPGPEDIWEPYIAWLVDAEGGAQGLLPTRDGGAALDACYPVELSVSRFVADDLVLVIPGAELGAFLYGTDGMLRETVDVGSFSTRRPDCGPEQKSLLYEEAFRTAWLSRHRVIDEVAANDAGDVFFFVRHVVDSQPALTPSTTGSSEGDRETAHELARGAPPVQGKNAEQIAAPDQQTGVARVGSFAVAPGSLSASELEQLMESAASQGGQSGAGGVTISTPGGWNLGQLRMWFGGAPTFSAAEHGYDDVDVFRGLQAGITAPAGQRDVGL